MENNNFIINTLTKNTWKQVLDKFNSVLCCNNFMSHKLKTNQIMTSSEHFQTTFTMTPSERQGYYSVAKGINQKEKTEQNSLADCTPFICKKIIHKLSKHNIWLHQSNQSYQIRKKKAKCKQTRYLVEYQKSLEKLKIPAHRKTQQHI